MLGKLQAKRLFALCALFALQWSCLKTKNWPDNLPITNRNCFCFCYVTTQIIFDFSVNKYQTNKYFSTTFFSGWVLHRSHWAWQFLNTVISQGRVAMLLRCGGIFNNNSVQIYYWVCQWKNFENWLAFVVVMDESCEARLNQSGCRVCVCVEFFSDQPLSPSSFDRSRWNLAWWEVLGGSIP